MSRIYDITPPVTPTLAVWPGDTPASREVRRGGPQRLRRLFYPAVNSPCDGHNEIAKA